LASITPGIESNPGNENAGIKTPSPLLTNDWFSIGRVERSSRMRGKFDPEHFGIERNVVAYTSTALWRASPKDGWGVVKSLARWSCGPVGLVHTQKIEAQSEKPTWTKALEFTQFACPCGTDPRLLSGEQRTSHFKLVTSVDDPNSDIGLSLNDR
jgi:hypothetical protein